MKSGAIAGSRIVTTQQYFGNGQLSSTQTPGQYAAGVSSSFTYDADQNKLTETHHYAGIATTYTMWYDGVGRLVEVKKPADTRAINGMRVDYAGNAWLTRYLYGLSGTTSVSFGNISTVSAHGDLFKTQEYGGASTNAWVDTKGTSYDALDRAVAKLYYAPGDDQTVRQDTLVYDNTAANDGYLGTRTNALGQQQIFSYTPEGKPQQITFAGDGGTTPARSYTYDADGRSTAISSTVYGTKGLAYDTDGRVISEQEPSNGNLTSPATLNYTYYPNGLKRGVSVSSSSLSQTDMELYAYRADGRISWQQFSYAGKTYAQTIGYTPGGRPTSMSDSYLANAYQFSYDTTGRINTYTIPSATFSNISYDPEDEVTAFNGYGTNVTNNYSSRGEFVGKTFANDPCSSTTGTLQRNGSQQQLWNGVALPVGWNSQTCTYENIGANSDFPSGALLASHNNPGDYQYFDFDSVGRENEVQTMTPCTGSADKCSDPTATSEDDMFKSYDAEDHLVSTGTSATNQPTTFGWGPDGHPVRVATTAGAIDMYSDTALTIHWDGNSVLFVTAQNGTLRDIKFGTAAVMVPNSTTYSGITAIDRDWSGENIAAHNSTGHTQASGSDGYAFQPYPSQQGSFVMDDLTEVSEPRADGVRILSGEDGAIFQGVRSYDSASQQWMSRDALSGELHDPMTQKAYVWNLNNPIVYSDPSGYEGCVTSQCMQQWQAGSRAAGDAAYRIANWLIGDQVRTLENPHSTLGQKVLAGLLIASTVPGLEEGVAAKGIAVIGHYAAGYIDVAKSLNASHFDLGKDAWNILNRISPEIPEALNLKFLQDMAAKGTPFLVVTGPEGVQEGSWLEWEIDQLRKMGYDWDASHHWLLPPGPAKP